MIKEGASFRWHLKGMRNWCFFSGKGRNTTTTTTTTKRERKKKKGGKINRKRSVFSFCCSCYYQIWLATITSSSSSSNSSSSRNGGQVIRGRTKIKRGKTDAHKVESIAIKGRTSFTIWRRRPTVDGGKAEFLLKTLALYPTTQVPWLVESGGRYQAAIKTQHYPPKQPQTVHDSRFNAVSIYIYIYINVCVYVYFKYKIKYRSSWEDHIETTVHIYIYIYI